MPPRSSSSEPAARRRHALAGLLFAVLVVAAVLWPATLVLPPYLALQTLFRHVMYPLLTGEAGAQPFPHAPGVYFLVVTPAIITLVFLLVRGVVRALPPGTYILRAAKAFGLMVLAMYILNSGVQGGLGIPLALVYAVLLAIVCWRAQPAEWARRLLTAVVWAGAGFLLASGAILPLSSGVPRFDLQRLHSLYGYLWMAAVGVYLVGHIAHYEAKRETASRNWGYLAAAILAAAALTGLARLHAGGETSASGLWPHVVTGVAACLATAVHVGGSWRRRGLRMRLGPAPSTGAFVLACLGLGLLLPGLPLALLDARPPALPAIDREALRAPPEPGATASGPDGAGLAAQLVSLHAAPVSCGGNGGCHVDTQAQWERSAHRHSANAAYRQTVRLLIEEQGIERARLCAGCHDPVPLLGGRIVAGSGYPFAESEGVSCVVCHSMQPGIEARNGHYVVAPSATATGSLRDPFTAYMMIELYRDQHRADHLPVSLSDNSMCASCHNLTTEHLVLRRTFDEWREGPFGPHGAQSRNCVGCHMPPIGETYLGFFKLRDHRMPAANVALAPLRGESGELERAFIAAALELQASVAASADGFRLDLRLTNARGGHEFPTAPRDLLDYWVEVQFEGGGRQSDWQRVDRAGLFPEQLISAQGDVLTRHEIWRAVEKRGGEGIAPGETRAFSFALPAAPEAVERINVRLMHRRYRSPFLDFLRPDPSQLATAPVEILRVGASWPAADLASR
ncbi:MAG: multiheme c-type cytochrome [Deltaproteobacteria bacterium]|nr:multiheme c-type cytochrome [Deltaproteobacteria bacterium]